MLRIKDSVDLTCLKKYGFELGQNFVDRGERCICNEFEYEDYWKFSMSEEFPDKVEYANSDFDQALVSIHVQSRFNNRIWIDCTPSCTYHIEGFDLSIVTDTLYQMLQDGVLELIPYVE